MFISYFFYDLINQLTATTVFSTFLFSGLERGLDGMKAGGERVITIPSKLGYGSKGSGAEIPPDSDLIFEVKVIKVG